MSTLLPTSNALAEASPDSLSELMSRDPEHNSAIDEDKIVLILREQRARYNQAEAAGLKPPRPTKAAPPPPPPVTDPSSIDF